MHNELFLLCPTDCLEPIINNTFKYNNYFYTSLGNSFNADSETLNRIKCMVKKHSIRKIYFVLACDNKIIKDALAHQDFSNINGLTNFYSEITQQKEQSKTIYQKGNQQLIVLSYYLNKKIKALQLEFDNFFNSSIAIAGKIYNRNDTTFTTIYSNLICLKKHQLN